jgi:4-hydroxy-3-methylbut-2-en-1-yl diphosphate reductase
MTIIQASHLGMCFGVRDAIQAAADLASSGAHATILGQIAHNPDLRQELAGLGLQEGDLDQPAANTPSPHVVITPHGASDAARQCRRDSGKQLLDTTCPLVHKAHRALRSLVDAGYHPVVIGQASHVEVRGLIGDFPHAHVVLSSAEIDALPHLPRIGMVSQTTQPTALVKGLVNHARSTRPDAELRHIDTVCQPTKDRQKALADLCASATIVIVVGGKNSNNTRQLRLAAQALGRAAHHVETPADLDPNWFSPTDRVGLTAGTSTPDHAIQAIAQALHALAQTMPSQDRRSQAPQESLTAVP